jgi:broad specificity phosphatase PhoE
MPGGESLRLVLERSWRGLARATEGLGEHDTLLVVAHDAVNRVILCKVLGLPIPACGPSARHRPRSTCSKAPTWTAWKWCA